MADVKLQGIDYIVKLLGKKDTWELPNSIDFFLKLVRSVLSTSKYKDGFMDGKPETLENLRSFVQVKANRVKQHPDLEECVDVAAYAAMAFHAFLQQGGVVSYFISAIEQKVRQLQDDSKIGYLSAETKKEPGEVLDVGRPGLDDTDEHLDVVQL